jgi:hypothetical protein
LDDYELNLFAAKPDRARLLSDQGFLVDLFPAWWPTAEDCRCAESLWRDQIFAPIIDESRNVTLADAGYRNALAAYATWRAADKPTAVRCAALALALRGLRAACRRMPTLGRLSTLARVAWESGARGESVAVLHRVINTLQTGQAQVDEPFWPAAARFDHIKPDRQPANWFCAALAEQYEKTFSFSSAFNGASPTLTWLCNQTFVSTEMERRRVLTGARSGFRQSVPKRLCEAASDHLNAAIWRAGKVPGTIVDVV